MTSRTSQTAAAGNGTVGPPSPFAPVAGRGGRLPSGPVRGGKDREGTPAGTGEGSVPPVPAGPMSWEPGVDEGERDRAPAQPPRTWVIELPSGLELLNANDRDGHWARRKRVTEALRAAAGWLARKQQVPPMRRAHVLAVYEPPDRRRRDPANLYPSVKACVDGLVDAGVLPDDDATHLDGPDMRLGPTHPRGRIVLHITEVPQ